MHHALSEFVDLGHFARLVALERLEDVGSGDITTQACVPKSATGKRKYVARIQGILCGADLLKTLINEYDPEHALLVDVLLKDGTPLEPGDVIATISGPLDIIHIVERPSLNLLTHLSGIATYSYQFIEAVYEERGCRAKVCATRKTHLGLRGLEKWAVACGGADPHRLGLYDAVLIKDNHFHWEQATDTSKLTEWIVSALESTLQRSAMPKFFEVEVDSLEQLDQVLRCPREKCPQELPFIVLLDNMSREQIEEAIKRRNTHAPWIQLEVSGGITLENIRRFAIPGVDRISSGAITYNAQWLDIGLDVVEA